MRQHHQEPHVLRHFGNPDRHGEGPGGAVLMECPDLTHPGRSQPPPHWQPDRPEDPALLAEWGLSCEPGVVVKPGHPCKGDAIARMLVPTYDGDPCEVWSEAESCGLRVVRLYLEEDAAARNPTFTMVALKDQMKGEGDT